MSRLALRMSGSIFWVAGLATSSGVAFGQDHTADPYKPYNNQYQQFVYPTAPSNLALPGQARIYTEAATGAFSERARQSELFADEENIFDRGTSGSPGAYVGVPYYRAFRQYDKSYGRDSSPNRTRDRQFQKDREQFSQRRQEAGLEKDPKKRAELLKGVERDELKLFRSSNEGRNSPNVPPPDFGETSDRDSASLRAERSFDPARRTARTTPSGARTPARRATTVPPMIAAPSSETTRRAAPDRAKNARPARTKTGTAAARPSANAEPTPEEALERSDRMSREASQAIPPPPPIP
jgi:hypothetical protein